MEADALAYVNGPSTCFAGPHDPRVQGRRDHAPLDVLAVTVLAVLCGADDWPEVEVFGRKREDWLKTLPPPPNGIPSHDTFRRVFGSLDRRRFPTRPFQWAQALHEATGGRVIAIDGKTVRRSSRKKSGPGALHLVTAWATESGLTLGQVACAEKSNEITAIPELLTLLNLKGCTVAIDAMGRRKEIAARIRARKGHYAPALKGNQSGPEEGPRPLPPRELETPALASKGRTHETKQVWRWIAPFQPVPWVLEVGGLVAKPRTLDIDDLLHTFAPALEERVYRHRCVEAWAMAVPWTGVPLAALLRRVEPLPAARFVRFISFDRPDQASRQADAAYPWPYTEGLTLAEAGNELAFLAVGMYGHPLLKQHGAPVRLVLPWKYGFKSAKSIRRIELTAERPATFWNTLGPNEYDFTANVNPAVPHPRWSQAAEHMLGTGEVRPTQPYNGYGEWVAGLYA